MHSSDKDSDERHERASEFDAPAAILYATKRICVAVFGLKDDLSLQLCHQSSLLGNTKLTLER